MKTEKGYIESSQLICDMDVTERPREKAIEKGLKHLSDAELMAIIFATGVKGKSVLSLCQEILDDNKGHLSLLAAMSPRELASKYKGIGLVKAITLLAALEIGERSALDANKRANQEPVRSSDIAVKMMRWHFQWLQHEEFWVMYVNRGGHPIREVCISKGGTCATTVDVKLIMRNALECLASSMLLFHNHPSGNLRPSVEDDKLTSRIVDAAKLLDLRVNDHIIITDGSYYSYSDHGRL